MLVNPTKFLGNLLIAGELIQCFERYCRDNNIALLLVLDDNFREICEQAFTHADFVWYPRRTIEHRRGLRSLLRYWDCLRRIRAFRACIAFNIEEDSVSDRFTQLSRARFRLGCSAARNRYFYHHVLPIDYVDRPAGQQHRWYSYREVFAALGMPIPDEPRYLRLPFSTAPESFRLQLSSMGVDFSRPLVVLHPGATKPYKRWPLRHFTNLAILMINAGYMPVVIGAGDNDNTAAMSLLLQLESEGHAGNIVNLCNQLSLLELAWLLTLSRTMVGNDSGPFHLASGLDIPGVVLFGPTISEVWRPLGARSVLLKRSDICQVDCGRHSCRLGYQCLEAVLPEDVINEVERLQKDTIST